MAEGSQGTGSGVCGSADRLASYSHDRTTHATPARARLLRGAVQSASLRVRDARRSSIRVASRPPSPRTKAGMSSSFQTRAIPSDMDSIHYHVDKTLTLAGAPVVALPDDLRRHAWGHRPRRVEHMDTLISPAWAQTRAPAPLGLGAASGWNREPGLAALVEIHNGLLRLDGQPYPACARVDVQTEIYKPFTQVPAPVPSPWRCTFVPRTPGFQHAPGLYTFRSSNELDNGKTRT
ncbi:hypothetical protein AURDEDRAFT_187719 [Auricularia subglabra TFB-10046 SS5]|nr:hypothetical protein AURDEDRAFT_187719 [Auricularia subglabra TFB-10046 SS5]